MKSRLEERLVGKMRESAVLQLFVGISISLHAVAFGAVARYNPSEMKPDNAVKIISVDMNELAPPPVLPKKTESVKVSTSKPVVALRTAPPIEQPPPLKVAAQTVKESAPPVTTAMALAPKQLVPQTAIAPAIPLPHPARSNADVRQVVARPAQDEQGISQEREYGRIIRGVIEKHKEYPLIARKSGIEGVVVVKFILSCDGELKSAELHRSCGRTVLDTAAINTLKGIRRFPPHPDKNKRADLSFELPIAYKISSDR